MENQEPAWTPHTRLAPATTRGAAAAGDPLDGLELAIPAGPAEAYRLAQLDDYRGLRRADFPWQPPIRLSLQARADPAAIPGTWGFGFWNAPFSLGLGFGSRRILPALPNAAWFFFASPQNYLSFQDDQPANGFLAQTFRSPAFPALLFTPGLLLLPLLLFRPAARGLRRLAGRLIRESAVSVDVDTTAWHDYEIRWEASQVEFWVDGIRHQRTGISPNGPAGLVFWVDNQFAAFTPEGRLAFGTLACDHRAILSIRRLRLDR